MKQTIIILGLTFVVNLSLKSQEYVPFPLENAIWNISIKNGCDYSSDTLLYRFIIQGDTTIKDKLYKKLCIEKGDTVNPIIETIGGLREEGKKIFYRGTDFLGYQTIDSVMLLYDFTKQIGDTIIHDTWSHHISIILDIDSILIDDVYRKRYKVNNHWFYHNPDYIIEGIGSVKNGLLGHITEIPECDSHFWEHICFRENGIVKYLNPSFNNCFPSNLLTGIALPDYETDFEIFPNPFSNVIKIKNKLNHQDLTFKLIDINGKTLIEKNINIDKVTLDLNISSGLYNALIVDKNGKILMTKKVIKK